MGGSPQFLAITSGSRGPRRGDRDGESRKRVASGYGKQRGCDEERSVEDENCCAPGLVLVPGLHSGQNRMTAPPDGSGSS